MSVTLSEIEVKGLSENEVKTLAWLRVKPTAIRVYEQIEPFDESDNAAGFELGPSAPKRIELYGSTVVTIENAAEYQAAVYDQYNKIMTSELTWTNKVIAATEVGEVVVTQNE